MLLISLQRTQTRIFMRCGQVKEESALVVKRTACVHYENPNSWKWSTHHHTSKRALVCRCLRRTGESHPQVHIQIEPLTIKERHAFTCCDGYMHILQQSSGRPCSSRMCLPFVCALHDTLCDALYVFTLPTIVDVFFLYSFVMVDFLL